MTRAGWGNHCLMDPRQDGLEGAGHTTVCQVSFDSLMACQKGACGDLLSRCMLVTRLVVQVNMAERVEPSVCC